MPNNTNKIITVAASFVAAWIILLGTLTYTFHMGGLAARRSVEADFYVSKYSSETATLVHDCWSREEHSAAVNCVKDALASSREAQRGEDELAAQKAMSDWAFWALVVATASAVVTSVGTFLLYQQIILTREAVEDTSRATSAMEKQNEFLQAQAAPDVKLSCCLLAHHDDSWMNITASNFGGSKATDFQITSAIISILETNMSSVILKNRRDSDDLVDISINGSNHGFDFRPEAQFPPLGELLGKIVMIRIAWKYKNLLGGLEVNDGAWQGTIIADPHQQPGALRADMVRKA